MDPRWLWQYAFIIIVSILIPLYTRRLPITYRLMWIAGLLLSANFGFNPYLTKQLGENYPASDFVKHSLQTWIFLLVIPKLVLELSQKRIRQVFFGLHLVMCIDAVRILTGSYMGFINGRTFDTTVMALLFPFVPRKYWWTLGLPLAAIVYSKGLTSYLILMVYVAWYLKKRAVLLLPILVALHFWLPEFIKMKLLAGGSGRVRAWSNAMTTWYYKADIWFGTGLNTFRTLGLTIPIKKGSTYTHYIMHNDFLQMVFEVGIVGGSIFLLFCGYVLYRLKGFWRAYGIAYGIAMLTYFPLHAIPTQLLGMWIIKKSLTHGSRQIPRLETACGLQQSSNQSHRLPT